MRTGVPLGDGGPVGASQQRVNARDELARAERLGHVVVGADRQPDEQVGLAVARGQHEHGQGTVALDLLADFDAVETGQHEVEHDEVGAEPLAQLHAARSVTRDLDLVTLAAQPGRDRGRDRLLVLDHRDATGGRRRHHRSGCARRRGNLHVSRIKTGRGGVGMRLWRNRADVLPGCIVR